MRNHPPSWPRIRVRPKILFVKTASVDLLDHYQHGDERAASALFDRYVERLTHMVRQQLGPSMRQRLDPEDAVHSAYRSFFVRARDGQFAVQRSGELWKLLVTITLNKLRRQFAHHRAGKRAVQRDRPLAEFIDRSNVPSPLEALAAADELAAFLAKLNPLQRQVLQLRLQEQRWNEIAKTTGKPERTVRRVLENVRDLWRALLPAEDRDIEIGDCAAPIDESTTFVPLSNPLDYRDFRLEKLIGSGGMGKVYCALQKSSGRHVAVKMLRKARWKQPGAVDRFLDEARTVMRLRHPGIVVVHGLGQTLSGGPFIVMDLIEGDDLAKLAAAQRPSPTQAADWVRKAAEALQNAHEQGIVHCDLKPSNLLRASTGRIVVSDFGMAATRTSSGSYQLWGGTPAFMAPEQLDPAFGSISPATDIFALGLVLFNLITGKTLIGERPVLEVVESWRDGTAISREDLIAARVPAALVEVIQHCLAIDPVERFASAGALSETLRTTSPHLQSP